MSLAVFERTFTVNGCAERTTLAVRFACLMSLLTLLAIASSSKAPSGRWVVAAQVGRRLNLLRAVILVALTAKLACRSAGLGMVPFCVSMRAIRLQLPNVYCFPVDYCGWEV